MAYVTMRTMSADPDIPSEATPAPAPSADPLHTMKLLRRRRWYLWSVILIYLPLMWTTLGLTANFPMRAAVFGGWFLLLLISALLAALARCPRCGNYFHVHGMSFLPLRQCLHCQLHINQDKSVSDEE
jgi:hypothetical protein